jgi:CRP-like cAMP-binding protein
LFFVIPPLPPLKLLIFKGFFVILFKFRLSFYKFVYELTPKVNSLTLYLININLLMTLDEYLLKNCSFSKKELPVKTKRMVFAKGTIPSVEGEIEKQIYYLVSGSLKCVIQSEKGDRILDFILAGKLFSSVVSVISQTPANVHLKCVSDCVVDVIDFEELKTACKTSIKANEFLIHFISDQYITRVGKEKDLISKSVEQRYFELLENRKELFVNIPSTDIAKYLGIHPLSLSRLKKQSLERNKGK